MIFASRTAAWAQTPAAASSLPVGTPLTIVADDTVDARVRPGSEFRAHLRDPLELGSTLVATAGTSARVVVTGKDTAKDGTPRYRIAIIGLNLGLAGTLPVRPDSPVVDRIASGTQIPATTLASIGYEEGKLRVAIPLPFTLSNEPPNSGYTPAPLRTASPITPRPRRRSTKPTAPPAPPTPGETPGPPDSPAPTASPAPAASASPAALRGRMFSRP